MSNDGVLYLVIYSAITDSPLKVGLVAVLLERTSLVPKPLPVFQCCTLKNERAWKMKSREKRHWRVINNERGRWNVAVACTWPAADTVVQCCYILW